MSQIVFVQEPAWQPGFIGGRAFRLAEGEMREKSIERFKESQIKRCAFLGPYYRCQDCNYNILEWGGETRIIVGKESENEQTGKMQCDYLWKQICPACWRAGKKRLWEKEQYERERHVKTQSRLPEHIKAAALAVEVVGESFDGDVEASR